MSLLLEQPVDDRVYVMRLKRGSVADIDTAGHQLTKRRRSQRDISLVGASLWACKRLLETNDDSIFAFPRYCNEKTANANSASGALNKWLSDYAPDGCVIHSFRHSMRDRLRAFQCPSNMIDQIGGWTTAGVGQKYGEGFSLQIMQAKLYSTILLASN